MIINELISVEENNYFVSYLTSSYSQMEHPTSAFYPGCGDFDPGEKASKKMRGAFPMIGFLLLQDHRNIKGDNFLRGSAALCKAG